MASNRELYDLVKSLTASERRYLKKLMKAMAGNRQKKYQDHFDKVVSMKKYDDLIWKRKMGLKVTKKQISETTNYLYDFILKGLLLYTNAKDKSKNKVLVESQKIHILQQKGLYETTMKRIDELLELALEQQFFDLSLHLYNEKRSVAFHTGLLTTNRKQLYSIYDDFDDAIEKAGNINSYLRLLVICKSLIEEHETIRSARVEQRFIDFLQHDLMRSSDRALCQRSKNLYFVLKLLFLITLYWEEEAVALSDESIAYFGGKEQRIANPMYLGFMINKRLELCRIFGRWQEFEVYLKRFHSMAKGLKFYQQRKYWFINGFRHDLKLYYASGNVEAFKWRMDALDTEFFEACAFDYADAFNEAQFSMVKLFHMAGDYDAALEHVNILMERKAYVRKELLLAVKVLYLILHYDVGNDMYLPYAVQSLYRSLLKSSSDYKAEARLIAFLKKLPRMVDGRDLVKAKRQLLKDWTDMKSDPFQRDFFFYFPYTEWISAKIEDKPFREVYMKTAYRSAG